MRVARPPEWATVRAFTWAYMTWLTTTTWWVTIPRHANSAMFAIYVASSLFGLYFLVCWRMAMVRIERARRELGLLLMLTGSSGADSEGEQ